MIGHIRIIAIVMSVKPHLEAWKREPTTWKGPYDIGPMTSRLPKGARVLDAGCGSGKLLLPLSRAGFDVTGMDIGRHYLLSIPKGYFGLVEGDVISLPFKDACFDAVLCHDVLQHMLKDERESAIKEALRVLKPGGTYFVEAFGREDMRYGGDEVEPHTFKRQEGIVYHYFDIEEMRSLLGCFSSLETEVRISKKTFKGKEYVRQRIAAIAVK